MSTRDRQYQGGPSPGGSIVREVLDGTLDTPSRARAIVGAFADHVDPETFERTRLLVTEAVTNSLRHAEPPIELEARVERGAVEVTVRDAGPGFAPPAIDGRPIPGTGMGLYLIQLLSTGWGAGGPGRPWIWFRIHAHANGSRPDPIRLTD